MLNQPNQATLSAYTPQMAFNPSLPINQRLGYDTILTPDQESKFQDWAKVLGSQNPNFSGAGEGTHPDYDYRAAWLALQHGVDIGGINDYDHLFHLNDVGKKPNHESFSNESVYAQDHPEQAGSWAVTPPNKVPFQAPGNYQLEYIPPLSGLLTPRSDAGLGMNY